MKENVVIREAVVVKPPNPLKGLQENLLDKNKFLFINLSITPSGDGGKK
jgi:hypothetical protein